MCEIVVADAVHSSDAYPSGAALYGTYYAHLKCALLFTLVCVMQKYSKMYAGGCYRDAFICVQRARM